MLFHQLALPVPIFWALVLLLCGYLTAQYVYRLIFHPLARFPGPKLAAMSFAYEFYYDVYLGGKMTAHLTELHRQYGPIIRINPNEIHISDPGFFDQLYHRTEKQDRPAYFGHRFGNASDTFSSLHHDLHKARRKALCPMFSDRQISRFQPVIQSKLESLCEKLRSASINGYNRGGDRTLACSLPFSPSRCPQRKGTDVVVRMDRAWMALTTDIITEYAFARSFGHLDSPGFRETVDDSLRAIYVTGQAALFCPIVFPILSILPDAVTLRIKPALRTVLGMRKDLAQKIREIRNEMQYCKTDPNQPPLSVFHQLLSSDLPPSEKSDARLGDEAQLIVGAGLVTTSWALSVATYHISANEEVGNRLRAELATVMRQCHTQPSLCPGSGQGYPYPDWHELEALPYLNACVHESVRLSHGLSTRSARVSNTKPIHYRQWEIPAHTPVAMTAQHILMDETIFPDPTKFDPDRWLVTPGLKKYFVPFGKGSRQCLGMNLAFAELYLAIATVFSRFRFELWETDESDVRMEHAYLVPYPKWDSKGVRVKVWCLDECDEAE